MIDGSVTSFHVDHWIASVVDQSEALESAVTDFGASLYPPLDVVARNGLVILASAWQVVVVRSFTTRQYYTPHPS